MMLWSIGHHSAGHVQFSNLVPKRFHEYFCVWWSPIRPAFASFHRTIRDGVRVFFSGNRKNHFNNFFQLYLFRPFSNKIDGNLIKTDIRYLSGMIFGMKYLKNSLKML